MKCKDSSMANSEDIEARLCAYIEGELTPAERTEIERHLEEHPGHRQMMQELVRTRNLMGELPRMNAPGDLSEGLQSHLERSMLLGRGLSGDEARPGRFGRSAQVAILAGVFALAVGFSSWIYYMIHEASHPVDVTTAVVQTVNPQSPAPVDLPPPLAQIQTAPATRPSDTQPSVVAVVDDDAAIMPVVTTQPSPPTTQEAVAVVPATQPAEPTTLPSDAAADLGNSAIPADFPSPPATQPAVEISPPTTAPVADDGAGK
jgi:anti-sigma factor RsiW